MRNTFFPIALLFLFINSGLISAQEIGVSDPEMSLVGNRIHISYNILSNNPAQAFNVELEVKDAQGKRINATFLSGDTGEGVSGGSGKTIIWDFEKDDARLDGDIFVKVHVKAMEAPVAVVPVPEEKAVPFDETAASSTGKQFSRAGLVAQSVLFPGLGLSRYKGDPHWLKGVAAYGCIAGSVLMNRSAVSTYNSIIDESDLEIKNQLYDKAITRDNISEGLAYTALAIWITDLVWTIIGASDIDIRNAHTKGLRVNAAVDPVSWAPLLAFTYKF